MNETNPLAEAKATLAISDLKRRDRLLKIIRGKPWIFYTSVAMCIILIGYIFYTGKADNVTALFVSICLVGGIVEVYRDVSRRMNAVVDLIGEDNLIKPKTDDKERTA